MELNEKIKIKLEIFKYLYIVLKIRVPEIIGIRNKIGHFFV